MATYWVFSAPDDNLEPIIWHNGVEVQDVDSHFDAAQRRFGIASPAGISLGDFWVAGPDEGGHLKLIRFKIEPTAFRIYPPERS